MQWLKNHIREIFIGFSVLFLVSLVGFYGYRLVYYYRLEHPKKQVESNLLADKVLQQHKDILVEEKNRFYFTGDVSNNYVYFRGRMFRILGINENGSISLISDELQTSLVYGYSKEQGSYVDEWLNKSEVSGSGTFEASIDSSFFEKGIWCFDDTCEKQKTSLVTLLSKEEYRLAGGKNGYLNNGKTWYLGSLTEEEKNLVVLSDGSLHAFDAKEESASYGVRPVIHIKKSQLYVSGDGSLTHPYLLEERKITDAKQLAIGEYIMLDQQIYRVLQIEEKRIKLVACDVLKEKGEEIIKSFSRYSNQFSISSYGNIGQYLNQDYYHTLMYQDLLTTGPFIISSYNEENGYDYKIKEEVEEANIGLLKIGDLFITDISKAFLLTGSGFDSDMIFSVNEDGTLYADLYEEEKAIRPVLYIKNNFELKSGTGSKEDPYQIK